MLAYVDGPQRGQLAAPGTTLSFDAMDAYARGEADAFIGSHSNPWNCRRRKWAHDREHHHRSALVTVLLLYMLGADPELCCNALLGDHQSVAMAAILKAADLCASDPLLVARFLSESSTNGGMKSAWKWWEGLPYNRWREAESGRHDPLPRPAPARGWR